MNFWRFLIADSIAALISVPLMLSIGYLAAEHYEGIFDTIRRLKGISIFVLITLLACGAWYYRKKIKEKRLARRKAASLAKSNHNSGSQ
jgi:membrane protein DedA with SNARE-associated domain